MGIEPTGTAAMVRRRKQGRIEVRVQAKIITLTATHSAILENISRKGASLSVETPPRRGSNAMLRWGSFEAMVTVSWVSGQRCGLLFMNGLAEEPLRATLALDVVSQLGEGSDLTSEAARAWAAGEDRSGFD